MASCLRCKKNPNRAASCKKSVHFEDGLTLPGVPYSSETDKRCPTCGVKPGGYHHFGCILAQCPRCGELYTTCKCPPVVLKVETSPAAGPFAGLATFKIYDATA